MIILFLPFSLDSSTVIGCEVIHDFFFAVEKYP